MTMPRLLFALFLPLMLLAACGQVPQPFAKAPTGGGYVAPEAPPPPEDSVLVRVHPVTGTAVPMGRLLAQAVSDALNGRNLTATTQPGSDARFELRGHARINDDDPRLPYVALIDWTLTDRGGGPAGLVTQGVEGSRWHWDYGDPRMIRSVARGAAGPVGDLVARDMPPDSSPPPLIPRRAAEPVVAKGPPLVRVAPVTGAPGDGNGALTRA
ncbi:MAG: hypothetical protein KDE22_11000, partial [Rhodobacterales bacterium]|nr:hypothetical protein [Rhodobacterales bacterium]